MSHTDQAGTTLTGTLTGTLFTVSGTVSVDVGFGCILMETITWDGTVDITTRNFTGSGTEVIVSNNPPLCGGFGSCVANKSVVGTRLTALQFGELLVTEGRAVLGEI